MLFDIEEDKLMLALNREINTNVIKYMSTFLSNTIKEKGVDTAKIRKILIENIDEKKLKKSKCGFGLVTFSLSERRGVELYKEEIPEGKLHDYILASSRLPGFKQEELDGKYYIDGRIC